MTSHWFFTNNCSAVNLARAMHIEWARDENGSVVNAFISAEIGSRVWVTVTGEDVQRLYNLIQRLAVEAGQSQKGGGT